jgi:hypothetical protein
MDAIGLGVVTNFKIMVRRRASLDTDETRLKLSEKRDDVPTLQLASHDRVAGCVDPMNLKYRLRNIETNRCDRIYAGSSES